MGPALRHALLVLISLLVALQLPGGVLAVVESGDQTAGMRVDVHWLDIYQNADLESLQVTENLWFNNTRGTPFAGDLYAWLPTGAQLISMCAVDMEEQTICFSTDKVDEHLMQGNPFQENPRNPGSKYTEVMSSYGQVVQASLNVTESGDGPTHRLPLRVAVGRAPGDGEAANRSSALLGLHTERDLLVLDQPEGNLSLPRYLEGELSVVVENLANRTQELHLELEGLPPFWSFDLPELGGGNLTLKVNESRRLALQVTLPHYLLEIQLRYTQTMPLSGEDRLAGTYSRRLLYPHGRTEFYVYALPASRVTFSENIFSHFNTYYEPYERDWYRSWGYDLEPETEIYATLSWEADQGQSDWSWAVLLLLVTLGLLLPALYRSGHLRLGPRATGEGPHAGVEELEHEEGEEALDQEPGPAPEVAEGEVNGRGSPPPLDPQGLDPVLEELKAQYSQGTISRRAYRELRRGFRERLGP